MNDLPTFETVLYGAHDGVATIFLNRPERLNAVIEQLYDDVLAALDTARSDPDVRTIVLTGQGRAFCVGADLKAHGEGARTPEQQRDYLTKANDVCRRLRTVPKPVIAAVNGYALGAGAEMAVSADFILVKQSAEIGFPEVSIGTFLGGGVTHVLPKLVGMARAKELVFTGRRINGEAAAAMGLATTFFPDDAFADGVAAFAAEIASKAPVSMALAKEHFTAGRAYEDALESELDGILACMGTDDWAEGVAAFAEKRAPRFKGR